MMTHMISVQLSDQRIINDNHVMLLPQALISNTTFSTCQDTIPFEVLHCPSITPQVVWGVVHVVSTCCLGFDVACCSWTELMFQCFFVFLFFGLSVQDHYLLHYHGGFVDVPYVVILQLVLYVLHVVNLLCLHHPSFHVVD